MKCKFCEKELQDDFTYCPYCGKRADGKVQCPHCGEWISEEFRFCPVCGTAISEKNEEVEKNVSMASEWIEKRAENDDKKSGNAVSSVSERVYKALNNDILKRIVFAVVATIFFVCSFMSVVTFDITDDFVDSTQQSMSYFNVDGKIKIEYTAVDLINYSFFALSTNYDDAKKYIEKHADEESVSDKLSDIIKDDNFATINLITKTLTLTPKGCKVISEFASDIDIVKLSYASVIYASGEDTEVEGVGSSLKAIGLLAFINILYSFAVFVVAIVNAFTGKIKCDTVLIAVMLALSLGLWAVISSATVNVGYGYGVLGMGGALAAMIAFAVIFIAYRIVVRGFSCQRENVKCLISNAVAIMGGIVILCCVSMPAVDVELKYKKSSEEGDEAVFGYSYNQFETFDQYYFDLGDGGYYEEEELLENFNYVAAYYSAEDKILLGSEALREQVGMNMLINTKFFSVTNNVSRSLMKVQPVFSVIEVYFAAALVAFGLAGICNRKNYAALKIIASILILLASAYCIFTPILEDKVFEVSSMPDIIGVQVGAAPIAQFVIGALCVVGMLVSLAFSKKYIGNIDDKKRYILLDTDVFTG